MASLLTTELTGVTQATYFLQLCGHDHSLHRNAGKKKEVRYAETDLKPCKAITAVIVPYPHNDANSETNISHAINVGNTYNIPVIVIRHEPYDMSNKLVTIETITNNVMSTIPNTSWAHVTRLMRAIQNTHEHLTHRCTVSLPEPTIPAAFIAEPEYDEDDTDEVDESFEYSDLTVSRVARTIAGARHLDIDISLACSECGKAIAVIETSQKKSKVAHNTVAVANRLDIPAYRIHYTLTASETLAAKATLYEYENDELEHTVNRNTVAWRNNPTAPQKPRLEMIPLKELVAKLQARIDEHQLTHATVNLIAS